jgi:excisionase family DNA binding protein
MSTMRSSKSTTAGSAVLPANLVSLAVAAEHIGVHPKTLRRQIADGTLTGYRIGRMVRVDLDEVGRRLITTITTTRTVG